MEVGGDVFVFDLRFAIGALRTTTVATAVVEFCRITLLQAGIMSAIRAECGKGNIKFSVELEFGGDDFEGSRTFFTAPSFVTACNHFV